GVVGRFADAAFPVREKRAYREASVEHDALLQEVWDVECVSTVKDGPSLDRIGMCRRFLDERVPQHVDFDGGVNGLQDLCGGRGNRSIYGSECARVRTERRCSSVKSGRDHGDAQFV